MYQMFNNWYSSLIMHKLVHVNFCHNLMTISHCKLISGTGITNVEQMLKISNKIILGFGVNLKNNTLSSLGFKKEVFYNIFYWGDIH